MTTTLTYPGPFRTIADIKQANRQAGETWFGPSEMRFFNSRIIPGVIFGRLFVTSERFDDSTPRLYTVRVANDDGSIDTLGRFQQHETLALARRWAKMARNV